MINSLSSTTNLRLFLPEVIWLEAEHFQRAAKISNPIKNELQQWQTYLNTLALSAFEEWLRERIFDQAINSEPNSIGNFCQLKVGEFKLGLITTEHILDEAVYIPQPAIARPDLAAHFYVVLEVAEEQEEVIIRGFLRYDELVNYRQKKNLQLFPDGCYQIPLSLFDAESNYLFFYCSHLEPNAIALPVAPVETGRVQNSLIRAKLSRWLEGVFDADWLSFEALLGNNANFAWSTRKKIEGAKGGKLIDLGMELGNHQVALLVTITPEDSEKLGIQAQLYPTGGERYLPPNIQLTLYSKTEQKLQSIQSRDFDNYIQLKPFKGKEGIYFSLGVNIGDINIIEDFEL